VSKQTVIDQIHAVARDRGSVLRGTVAAVLPQLEGLPGKVGPGPWKRVHVIGCGTSYYAAMVFKYVFEDLCGIPTESAQAFDFYSYQGADLLGPEVLVVGFSTAGDTEAVLRSIEKAKAAGARTVAITAVVDGPLARTCDAALLTGATDETNVPRTKGQLQGLLTLYLLGAGLGRSTGRLDAAAFRHAVGQIEAAVDAVSCAIESGERQMQDLARRYRECGSVFVLGCGPNLGTAHTGALMITEMAKVHALGDNIENFLHGRDREFDPSDPVFVLAPRGPSSPRTLDFLTVTRHVNAPTIVLTDRPDEDLGSLSTHLVTIAAGVEERFTPLVYLAPLLLFAHHLAVERGEDSNKRRYTDIVPTKVRFVARAGAERAS
jgi:glucosamine--fructose-6-phosphate aminotransferase (isomerizing)